MSRKKSKAKPANKGFYTQNSSDESDVESYTRNIIYGQTRGR